MANDITIKNATVITNGEDGVLSGARVDISGGKIAYVGSADAAPPESGRVIDADGDIVMPGFFNMHAHLPMTLLRGYADDMALQDWLFNRIFPAEDKLTDEMVYWGTLASLYEFAAAGIVCFNEMYSNIDAIAEATQKSGLRGVLCRGIVSPSPEITGDKLSEALDCHKKYHNCGRTIVYMAPHAQYTVNNETLSLLAKTAKELGVGLHVHVSETRAEHEECVKTHGKTPIQLFEQLGLLDVPVIAAHCVWVDDTDIKIMAERGVTVASCPRSNLKLASGIAPLKSMLDAGVNVALGTDSAASNNKLSIMSEMTLASFLQKGATLDPKAIPAAQAIRMATVNGARAINMDSGVIEAGKNADIIMIDAGGVRYSPGYDAVGSVVYASNENDVKLTMVGGDIIYENGKCSFADIGQIREKLKEYAAILQA